MKYTTYKLNQDQMQAILDGDRGAMKVSTIEQACALMDRAADDAARDIAEAIYEVVQDRIEFDDQNAIDMD